MFLLFVALVGVSVGKEPARMQGGPLGSTLFGSERFRHDEEVSDVAFTPDDKEMWAVTYETLVRWSMPEGDKLGTLPSPCPDGYMEAVAIAADGQRIAVGCSYDDIRLIDRKGRVQGTLTGSAEQLSFSADGKVLAAFRDSEVRFIDVAKNAVLERLNVDYECQWALRRAGGLRPRRQAGGGGAQRADPVAERRQRRAHLRASARSGLRAPAGGDRQGVVDGRR